MALGGFWLLRVAVAPTDDMDIGTRGTGGPPLRPTSRVCRGGRYRLHDSREPELLQWAYRPGDEPHLLV